MTAPKSQSKDLQAQTAPGAAGNRSNGAGDVNIKQEAAEGHLGQENEPSLDRNGK